MPASRPPRTPRSLVWNSELEVLPPSRVVERREDHWAVRSPSNPRHFWGNLLLFDESPGAGERGRWERLFEAEFADEPRVEHRTFAWDLPDGAPGAAGEFVARGYELERLTGLVASPADVRPHPRENREVAVRELDPRAGAEEELWSQVLELQVAGRPEGLVEDGSRDFHHARLGDLRAVLECGRGGWYVALDPRGDEVVASLGVVVTSGRGRYQAVHTAASYRRRGIARRLVREAAEHAAARHGAKRLLIVADPGYHALALYESVGFRRAESVAGVWRRPP